MAISGPFWPFLVSMEARSKQRAARSGEREARSAPAYLISPAGARTCVTSPAGTYTCVTSPEGVASAAGASWRPLSVCILHIYTFNCQVRTIPPVSVGEKVRYHT
jgi:hypothetical protein